ncbi:hypothetical protein PIB30_053567 [Stylosanthes scabra]|uniref:Protein kinase domain-containing protein n=1 Tax=Stylosanthes scabra TaxID=79078 RepID=A0ABU6RJF1_9FABA|nr:hypothetical protein [Stylosanthes scabra]
MEPKIGDFGLERIVTGDTSYKAGGSARIFGSKRSTASRDSFQDMTLGPSPSPSPSSISGVSPYHAPESLRNLKPSPKWDVYSFGVMFLELLSGKVVVLDDMGQGPGLLAEDKNRALRMADAAIRPEMEGKEEALLACFKLGSTRLSCSVPPNDISDEVQVLVVQQERQLSPEQIEEPKALVVTSFGRGNSGQQTSNQGMNKTFNKLKFGINNTNMCTFCGKHGHSVDACFKKHGYPSKSEEMRIHSC